MYDFLCLFPHANASHSLIHYLNQHKLMHVAPFTSIFRSLDDIHAYERHFRTCFGKVGIASKDYDTPETVKKVLDATSRELLILTVRDPVGSFVSQMNNGLFVWRLNELLGRPPGRETVEQVIADAVLRYITPSAAEAAYEVDTFKRYIILDIEDLKGAKAEPAVRSLWQAICGNSDPANQTSNHFKPIGARSFAQLRSMGPLRLTFAGRTITLFAVPEGDLWRGSYDAPRNIYSGWNDVVHVYPDANGLLPALKFEGPLAIAALSSEWAVIHPALRPGLIPQFLPMLEEHLRRFNDTFAEAEKAMTFKLEDLTPVQRDLLAAGIEDDFKKFQARHPHVADRWTTTRTFLGA